MSGRVTPFSSRSGRALGANWFQQGPSASALVRGQHLRRAHPFSGSEAGSKLGKEASQRTQWFTSTSGYRGFLCTLKGRLLLLFCVKRPFFFLIPTLVLTRVLVENARLP